MNLTKSSEDNNMADEKKKISNEKRNVLALVFFVTVFVYGLFVYMCNYLLKKDDE